MRISEFTDPRLVLIGTSPAPKQTLIERLLDLVRDVGIPLDRALTLQRLLEREREASTGLAHGVAIPHTVVDGMDRTVVAIATLPEGTDFESLDGERTRVIFLILNPTRKMGAHIRLLARLAGLTSHEGVIDRLAQAPDTDALLEVLREDDARHLAGP